MADVFRVGIPGDVALDTRLLMAPVLEEVFDPLPYVEFEFFDTREGVIAPDEIRNHDSAIAVPDTEEALPWKINPNKIC